MTYRVINRTPLLQGRSRQSNGKYAANLNAFGELIFRWSWLALGWGAFAYAVMQGQEDAEHETE
jgi:hypothetical protein